MGTKESSCADPEVETENHDNETPWLRILVRIPSPPVKYDD